jgi:hypothetical protein
LRIGYCKRTVLIGGEVSDGPRVCLVANEGDQLIYRVGVQVGERDLELLAAAIRNFMVGAGVYTFFALRLA